MNKPEAKELLTYFIDNDDDLYTGYLKNKEALKIAVNCIDWVIAFENMSDYLYTGSKVDWSKEDD